jgi:hypothetical protein
MKYACVIEWQKAFDGVSCTKFIAYAKLVLTGPEEN